MSTEEKLGRMRSEYVGTGRAAVGNAKGFDTAMAGIATDSPIERLLVAQMLLDGWWLEDIRGFRILHGPGGVMCTSQMVVVAGRRYRADFVFGVAVDRRIRAVSVELDGHDFHERTRGQASADRRRDRAFLSRGIVVIRFTGSDVYRDPAGVLCEIVALAHSNARARK